MTIKERHVYGLTSATPVAIGTIGLGASFGKLLGIRARNYASSAKAGAGTDTALRLKIVDNNSNVVYLDAADRDYATAEVILAIGQDDTATGLGTTAVDGTGAAATAGASVPIVMKSPIVVSAVNGGTVTDYLDIFVRVEV